MDIFITHQAKTICPNNSTGINNTITANFDIMKNAYILLDNRFLFYGCVRSNKGACPYPYTVPNMYIIFNDNMRGNLHIFPILAFSDITADL